MKKNYSFKNNDSLVVNLTLVCIFIITTTLTGLYLSAPKERFTTNIEPETEALDTSKAHTKKTNGEIQ